MSVRAGNHYSFKQDIKEFRTLSLRGKGHFLWDYYKLWIIGIVCFVSIAVFLTVKISTGLDGYWCYVGFVNTRAQVGDDSSLHDEFVEYGGYDLSIKGVEFNNALYFDYTDNSARGNTYYEMFVALVDSGVLDCAVMETDALVAFGQSGRFYDLSSPECASIMEKYGDRILYCEPNDTEYSSNPVPVGIDLSGSILDTDYDLYEGSFALGIGASTANMDAVEQFLDFIFAEAD